MSSPPGAPFCSLLARVGGEPLAGTASHARGCVLLAYPKRLWGHDALASEGLPAPLRAAFRALAEEHDVVTRLVAPEGPWRGRTEISLFPQRRRHRDVPLDDAAALLTGALAREPAPSGEPIEGPILAVCTHGRRDRCCARFGLELARALRERAAPGLEVREASHLGGDRFAPVVLVLPAGHMYGHLEPGDVPALLAAAAGGPPLAARFRGTLWLDPLRQLAEAAAIALRPGEPLRLGPIEVAELPGGACELRAALGGAEGGATLVVRCRPERRRVLGDCRSARTGLRGTVEAWRIDDARLEDR